MIVTSASILKKVFPVMNKQVNYEKLSSNKKKLNEMMDKI